ncbi:MAG TPA: PstS family phosphate ABC transporter substrate-binding protein [Longimicrobiales bacterium]|nr:PstS family phosphate ABC transporter substrate-binding protein [Longimicrobiales bacterium]
MNIRGTLAGLLVLAVVACGGDAGARGDGAADGGVSGAVEIDGSSTVYPITEAVAEEYMLENGGAVRVTVGISGTGGGFKRFCAGETDINDASRAIKPEETEACASVGVEAHEFAVAFDGLSVVVNPDNDWASCLTVAELRSIWEPGSTISNWSQVRGGFPDVPLVLYGPGTDSGTFDYFTEAINGEEDASRSDYTASEDDNVLVQGVAGDRGGLGYFGYAYYEENTDRMKVVGVDNGSGCVTPSPETVNSGEYAPLSRPVFIYVSSTAMERPAVVDFVRYYMENAPALVREVGYIPLPADQYEDNLARIGAVPAAMQ